LQARQATHEHSVKRLEQRANDLHRAITRRMAAYTALLRSGDGVFDAYGTVSREHWRTFVASLEIEKNYPGIRGLGYSKMIAPEQLAAHIKGIRLEGFPDYAVRPPGDRDQYSSIIYLEPFDWRNQRAFGYDMWSEPLRRDAMQHARDSGQPALSGRVTLVQETNQDVQHGVLMYMPVYRSAGHQQTMEQRRTDLRGFVYAPFRMSDLMQGLLDEGLSKIDIELYDGKVADADHLLYRTTEGPLLATTKQGEPAISTPMQIHDRSWLLYIQAQGGYVAPTDAALPWIVLVGGLGFNLLLFLLLDFLYRARQQAETMAQALSAANQELEEFAYIASHDLKEPVRGIHNYASFLQEDYADHLDATGKSYLVRMQRLSERMSLLIDKLLTWSRLGTGELVREPASLDKVLDEVMKDIGPLLAEHDVDIIRENPLPVVSCNPLQMGEVFQNLIVNGVRYNESTKRRIEIGCSAVLPTPTFFVRDNGIGIPSQHQRSVFRIFKRLHEQEKYGGGSGAGLTIVKRIIERHGGRIWVESPPGSGSTFYFTLPAESK
jgi:signal transduction histidine kinase